VECKSQGGRLSPEQKQFLAEIRVLGGFVVCVKSWKELDAALRGEGYATEDMTLFKAPEVEVQGREGN
jgi:hypothetical protein